MSNYAKLKKISMIFITCNENCKLAKNAGANVLVSGSTIFKENGGDLKKNIRLILIFIRKKYLFFKL